MSRQHPKRFESQTGTRPRNRVNSNSRVPSGWYNNAYLSATPSSSGHALVALSGGYFYDLSNDLGGYVALEVL